MLTGAALMLAPMMIGYIVVWTWWDQSRSARRTLRRLFMAQPRIRASHHQAQTTV